MKSCQAFTLIELMVVMLVLGALLTLLAPGAMAVKRQTTLSTSSSALRQLSIAAQTYLAENDGSFFRYREKANGGTQWWFGFESATGPSAEGQRVLDKSKGPLGPYIVDSAGTVPDYAFTSMGASFKPKFKNGYFGFGVNTELTGGILGSDTNRLRRINQLPQPGKIVLFATCAQINTFQPPASTKNPKLEEFYMFNTKSTEAKYAVHFRHSGRALVAYSDGSQGEIVGDPATFDKKLPKACVGSLPTEMILP